MTLSVLFPFPTSGPVNPQLSRGHEPVKHGEPVISSLLEAFRWEWPEVCISHGETWYAHQCAIVKEELV